jgi:L-fuconolactonase
MTIDSHHHFWNYSPEEYPWIKDDWTALRHDHLPADLKKEITAAGIDAVVSVQARTTVEETDWLLELADENDFVAGVVGWLPLTEATVSKELDRLAGRQKLKAIRHTLQGEPDERYMLRKDFNSGVSRLHDYGLAYDILTLQKHLPHIPEFVDRHPDVTFVLDHISKPVIETATPPQAWSAPIAELAKRDHVYCKLSGMVTEVRPDHWDADLLRPYFDHVLEVFGPGRLMFGTDWPVCKIRCSYTDWAATVRSFIAELSESEQAQIMGGTAAKAYAL